MAFVLNPKPLVLHDQGVIGIWFDDSQAASWIHVLLCNLYVGFCCGNADCTGDQQYHDVHGDCEDRKDDKVLKLGQCRTKQEDVRGGDECHICFCFPLDGERIVSNIVVICLASVKWEQRWAQEKAEEEEEEEEDDDEGEAHRFQNPKYHKYYFKTEIQ